MNELEKFKDTMSLKMFGRARSDALKEQVCVKCGTDMLDLRTRIERKEYTLSAMCGVCQREFFA